VIPSQAKVVGRDYDEYHEQENRRRASKTSKMAVTSIVKSADADARKAEEAARRARDRANLLRRLRERMDEEAAPTIGALDLDRGQLAAIYGTRLRGARRNGLAVAA
jgi:hypothetical protein